MKKVLCVLLSAFMLLTLLVSCNNVGDGTEESSTESESATEKMSTLDADIIRLVENGEARFYIVCEDMKSYGNIVDYISSDLREKSGVSFKTMPGEDPSLGLHMIYVGGNYAELFPQAEIKLSYKGYAAVYEGGNIYLCGNTATEIKSAASKLCSQISAKEYVKTDENGLTDMEIPTSLMFVYNPGYTVKDPTILSAHISEYQIVIPKNGGYLAEYQAQLISKRLAEDTGFILNIVTDDHSAKDREIILGNTSRKSLSMPDDPYAYSLKGEGGNLYLSFGSGNAFSGIIDNLKNLFCTADIDISGTVDKSACIERSSDEIRIMTSNVLDTKTEHSYALRTEIFVDLYLTYMPDFIGLQEASNFKKALSEKMSAYYTLIDQNGHHIPILYRKDIWKPSVNEDDEVIKSFERFGNMWGYEWVMFERIDDPTVKVIVMNLHFHNGNAMWSDLREGEMAKVNAEVKRLEALYSDIPMFVTGDYNTHQKSAPTADGRKDTFADIIDGTKLQTGAALTEDRTSDWEYVIDNICTNSELVDVVRHKTVNYTVMQISSDHRPYFIDVKLK